MLNSKPMKRVPMKRSPGTLKKSGGIKKKQKSPEQIKLQNDEYEKQWAFFLEIWNEREHICQCTGKWLGSKPKSLFFDHLLEKSIYSHLKYEKENIALVLGDIHCRKTNGFPHPKHLELINQAKIRFNV